MEREHHPFAPSRRHLGALLASAAAVAVPTVAVSLDGDAELMELERSASRSLAAAQAVLAARVDPNEDEFERLWRSGPMEAAWAFGRTYDRDGGIAASDVHYEAMDLDIEAAFAMPAKSAAGRAAKVRMLVRHYFEPLREPFRDLDYGQQLLRLVLAEYAGLTSDDFAAI